MSKIDKWLYTEKFDENFLMLPWELYEEEAFIKLNRTPRDFYIALNTFYHTTRQQNLLFANLHRYNELGLIHPQMTDEDIANEAFLARKYKYRKGLFVAPENDFIKIGFTSGQVSNMKKILEEAGFISIVCGGKGKYDGWSNNATIYKFSNKWKKGDNDSK